MRNRYNEAEVIRMRNSYAGSRVPKGLRQPKWLFIVVAAIGITAVTLINGAGSEDAGDVLSAGAEAGVVDAAAGNAEGVGDELSSADAVESISLNPTDVAQDIAGASAAHDESPIYVDVYGAVAAPSVYELENGSRVYDAIEMAGGLADDADIRFINRAATLNDGDRVYIPTTKETESGDPLPASAGAAGDSPGTSQGVSDAVVAGNGQDTSPNSGLININTADSATLQNLNGVGPATAQKIIDYRNSNGAFAKPEDLKNVSGIGDKTYEKLKDHISV
jgi:competence protein ComEA